MRTRVRAHTAVAVVGACLLLAGCTADRAGPLQPDDSGPTAAVRYLEQLIEVMRNNSVNRLTIDWPAFRTTVLDSAAGARSIPDAYRAIRTAMRLLGDNHSTYTALDGSVISERSFACTAAGHAAPVIPEGLGYVRVGTFGGAGVAAANYVNLLHDSIAAHDGSEVTGWVVDLRGNLGGNMWPMLAGIGPVLGEGLVGFFIDPSGTRVTWEYMDGVARSGGEPVQRIDRPYRLQRQEPPRVAVLTDGRVASSGEAIAIAFRGRPNTRSFGAPTCGLSTANRPFRLSDGAILNLSFAVMADRTGTAYGDSVMPDEVVPDPQAIVDRAVAWLIDSEGS